MEEWEENNEECGEEHKYKEDDEIERKKWGGKDEEMEEEKTLEGNWYQHTMP